MKHKEDCQICRDWFLDVQGAACQEDCPEEVVRHLEDCPGCRAEQSANEETFQLLSSLEEVEVPRHFFVYEESGKGLAWKGWWSMLLSARAMATVSSLALLLVMGVLVSRLQVRADGASLTFGVGTLPVLAKPRVEADPELLRAEFRRILAEEISVRDRQVLQQVKQEIASFGAQMEEAGNQRLERVLASLDGRLEESFRERDEVFSESMRSAALEIYQTLSSEQQRGLLNLNARLERIEETDHIQGTQTEALMATVIQLAQRHE